MQLLGSDSWGELSVENCSELEGAFYSALWYPDPNNPNAQTFVDTYQCTYNHPPDYTAALTDDAFGLLFEAIENHGKADPKSIRQGLQSNQPF